MAKLIKKKNIPFFINELKKSYQVYAPLKKGKEYVFDSISDKNASEIALEYPTTILPPKKFFFPQKETLFEFEGKNIKVPRLEEKTALFGLHLYDIHGLLILDTLFGHPEKDYYYLTRRKNTLVIGLNTPSRSPSFHEALGLDVHTGYDLFLNDIGDAFLATSETKEGDKLLKLPLFEESEWREGVTQKHREELFSNIPRLKKAVSQRKSKVWDDLVKRCFGCGICSYVCPVCYCFEVEDQINFDLHSGCRQRRWDACFLPDFSSLGSGYNVRANLKDRIYHWYYHKFVQMPDEIGKIGCVGCGRCIYYCPAKINYRDELEKIIKECS